MHKHSSSRYNQRLFLLCSNAGCVVLRSLEPENVFLSIAAIGRPTYPALKA